MIAVIDVFVLFVALNDGILPVPLNGKPID